MTSTNPSIPDSVSFKQLQDLASEAESNQLKEQVEEQVAEFEKLQDIARKHLQAAFDEHSDPFIHKVMMLEALSMMIEWHTQAGINVGSNSQGQDESAVYWLRDAGKFQAMCDIICSINVGPEDTITPMRK
jgi:hypothetical protein